MINAAVVSRGQRQRRRLLLDVWFFGFAFGLDCLIDPAFFKDLCFWIYRCRRKWRMKKNQLHTVMSWNKKWLDSGQTNGAQGHTYLGRYLNRKDLEDILINIIRILVAYIHIEVFYLVRVLVPNLRRSETKRLQEHYKFRSQCDHTFS